MNKTIMKQQRLFQGATLTSQPMLRKKTLHTSL